MAAQRVWFLLVDASGNELSSATSVRLARDDVVDDFRDAVMIKCPKLLSSIDAVQLLVYENRAAFDEKKPLEEDSDIEARGSSKKDALIVEVPERQWSVHGLGSAEELGVMVESRMNKVLESRDEKRSVCSLSDLNSEKQERIFKKMRLEADYLEFKEPVDTSVAGYKWKDAVAEDAAPQREEYMKYLKTHLKTIREEYDLELLDVVDDKTLLSIVDPRLPFRMNGTADAVLVDRRSIMHNDPLVGVRVVIELKRQVQRRHKPQAFGQLVSASLKAPLHCTPIGLLTDLNDHWHFAWFNAKKVLTHCSMRYPSNAFKFLAAAVADTDSAQPFTVPFIDRTFTKFKIDDFLPMPDDGADEMMERYELMADSLEPEFLMARRMEYAQHLVQSMPMYAHMYS
ncbi:hypothetical protein FI667_g11367, partial [Globisporangium splendens]